MIVKKGYLFINSINYREILFIAVNILTIMDSKMIGKGKSIAVLTSGGDAQGFINLNLVFYLYRNECCY